MKNLSPEEINLLRQNARCVVRELGLLNDAYFDIGVTLAERHLLIELSTCRHPTAGEIGERLLIDKSTVSRLIAKAVKKGYVQCSSDASDKRKRVLQMTEKGRGVLQAFEPIAFNQTKDALLTLTAEEIEKVHQGIALYAKGLKNSRLHLQEPPAPLVEKNCSFQKHGYFLKPYSQKDEQDLYEIFREVVDSGSQFPYESSSKEEFHRQFLPSPEQVYVCHSPDKKVAGGFCIRPNFCGRASHIANAVYMMRSIYRGQGIGSFLVETSLHIAKDLGFKAVQFNMVLSQNKIAVKLYQKFGFLIAGTLPEAIRNPDGSYQDGYVMYRKLDDL